MMFGICMFTISKSMLMSTATELSAHGCHFIESPGYCVVDVR